MNINVTAPGAIVALGLIYLKSNNEWVKTFTKFSAKVAGFPYMFTLILKFINYS